MKTKQDVFEYGATPVSRSIVLKGKTANFSVPVPAGMRLTRFAIRNNTANAVTGGIRVGSAAAGTQHVTAQAVAASQTVHGVFTLVPVLPAASGALFVEAVTSWNSANLDFRFEYDELLAPTLEETVNGVGLYAELGRH
jgi:hypothetical protein